VNLARSLCKHLLTSAQVDLGTYGGGLEADSDYTVPDYEEVVNDD
jgi:DNA (cytosine-5)-methyltransferase 1